MKVSEAIGCAFLDDDRNCLTTSASTIEGAFALVAMTCEASTVMGTCALVGKSYSVQKDEWSTYK